MNADKRSSPKCGEHIDNSWDFCPSCGSPLPLPDSATGDKVVCPSCGVRNPHGKAICLSCGYSLYGFTTSSSQVDLTVLHDIKESREGAPETKEHYIGYRILYAIGSCRGSFVEFLIALSYCFGCCSCGGLST